MTWSVHPAKDKRTKTILSLVFICGFLIFISLFYGIFWAILGFIFLFFALHSYYFPTLYEVNGEGVIIKNIFATQKRKLSEFKKVYQGKNGVLLSPFKHKTLLNHFRGVFLFLPVLSAQRDEIVNYLKGQILSYEEDNSKEPVENKQP